MIGIVDYGAGNLFSVRNALDYLQVPSVITADEKVLEETEAIILPGVGAFPDAMRMLRERGLVPVLQREARRKPFLGICLGMQLLFETGYEFGKTEGLGLIPGCVRKIDSRGLKIPHMGWNDLHILHPCAMTEELDDGQYVYFVHSYCADTPDENVSCYTVYGERIPALVRRGNIYGAQFHPEKSGQAGIAMLKNFVKLGGNDDSIAGD